MDFESEGATVEIDAVEAGVFEDGVWRTTRVINGDERLTILPPDTVGAARVHLLRIPEETP